MHPWSALDFSCEKKTKVENIPDENKINIPFPQLSMHWYRSQTEGASDNTKVLAGVNSCIVDDVIPFPLLSSKWYCQQNSQAHLLPFPDVSKKWYSSIKEAEVREYPGLVVFPALSKSWHQRRSKLLVKNDNRKDVSKAKGSLEQNI